MPSDDRKRAYRMDLLVASAMVAADEGIFKKHGLVLEIVYTSGAGETQQAVISGSMDIACGGGIESAIGGFSKGAPVRIIGSAMIGSPDTYWFVVANSPIKSLADALPVGPILIGPARPAHILTPSVTARGVLNMTAVAAVEAQERAGRQQPSLFG